jgi:hypothetical protein
MALSVILAFGENLSAQPAIPISLTRGVGSSVTIRAAGQPFALFLYPDSLEKPVLCPIYAPDGAAVTRGYPLYPKPGDPTDHPHHVGLWMNYENVNGLDFWNNSFAIPASRKSSYGWIRTDPRLQIAGGKEGVLAYRASWTDQSRVVLLMENTEFRFRAFPGLRIIDRISTLTASQNVSFPDAKDGFLGLRVAPELELPAPETRQYSDNHGVSSQVSASPAGIASGNYLTSAGKTGNGAWGTRATWCLLYGKIHEDSVSILMLDHPKNPGYPTYWHARGYGLFAANPLGQAVFSQGRDSLGWKLARGESAVFRYRIVIASGNHRLTDGQIAQLSAEFRRE